VPAPVAAIMPVVPFGLPMDGAAWDRLSEETGIPVIVDAAAAFDTWKPTASLSMVSLHATKLLGLGEGGLVLSRTRPLIADVRQRANFGFAGSRDTQIVSMNAKLSEYGAAVGLAALDGFAETRASFQRVSRRYVDRLGGLRQLALQTGFGHDWVTTTFNLLILDTPAVELAAALNELGIETRYWWGRGAHEHAAFRDLPRSELRTTRWLADHMVGLPISADMTDDDVDYVCAAVERFVQTASPAPRPLAVNSL
jgi:dTDP-4-amino-4,6-dideoxygalactose transaminase